MSTDFKDINWVWSVEYGPYNHSDFCDDPDCEDNFSWVVAKVTNGFNTDEIFEAEVAFGDFNAAYAFQKCVNESFGPVDCRAWFQSNLTENGVLKND